MDILSYIQRINQLYGSEQQVASATFGAGYAPGAPEETPMPNWRDLIREEGIQVGPQVKAPRNEKQVAGLSESFPGTFTSYNDAVSEGFQGTREEWLQQQSIPQIDRPFTGQAGGRVYNTRKYFKPGGLVEPGVTHYATKDEITAEKKKKAVTKIWEQRSPRQKDLIAKKTQMTIAKRYLNTESGKQLKWIADNGKNYENPQKMVTAFEKKFKKLNKAELFKNIPKTLEGSKKMYGLKYLAHAGNASLIKAHNIDNMFQFIPGFSEEELFKASILQNNSKAYNKMKNVLKMVHRDVGLLQDKASLLTVDDALKTLGKSEYQFLRNFDLISATAAPGSGHTYGGIHRGILRETLRDKGINENWMKSFQAIRTPLGSTDEIVQGLSSASMRKKWNVSLEEAKKIQDGWKNVSKGRYQAGKWIDSVDKLLGKEGQFRKIFGNVHFDHILTKDFGKYKDIAKNLPRDYLIQGNYSTAAFNQWKGVNFDKPLVRKIKAWKDAAPGSAKKLRLQGEIEDLYKRFNLATDNYAGSFKPSFEGGKFKWTETTERSPFKDVHRYVKDPKLAEKELAKTALGFEKLGTQGFKGIEKFQAKQNKFASLLSKNLDNLDDVTQKLLGERMGCLSSGGRVMLGKGGVVDCLKSKLNKDPMKFLTMSGESAAATKSKNLLKFIKAGRNIARGTGVFAMWEAAFAPVVAGFMVPSGESPSRIGYELAYGPVLEAFGIPAPGTSEAEEKTEFYGQSGYELSRMYELNEKYQNLEKQLNAEINKYAGQDYVGQKHGQIKNEMEKTKKDFEELVYKPTFYEGPTGKYWSDVKEDKAIQDIIKGEEALGAQREEYKQKYRDLGILPDTDWMTQQQTQWSNLGMSAGGRVPFGKGKLVDEGRRAFLKMIAALTGTAAVGATGLLKIIKGSKGVTTIKAGDHIIQGTSGMPNWFIPLINRVTKEGKNVTGKLGTVEREIVHTKSISKTEDVTVYQNLDTGNVRVEYGSPEFDKTGKVIRASNDPDVVHLEYKAPEVIESGKYKGQKTKSEFSAAESEPEVVNWDGDIEKSGINEVGNVDDLVTPTHKLKEFAKKKLTHRDKVIAKKKQKYKNKLEGDTTEQIDYIEKKHGPFPEPDEYAGGKDEMVDIFEKYRGKASGGRVDYDNYLPDIEDID